MEGGTGKYRPMYQEAKPHQNTLQEVKTIIKQLEQINISVEISWTPGHANIKGNEYADKLAKEAAQEAKEKDNLPPVGETGASSASGHVRHMAKFSM